MDKTPRITIEIDGLEKMQDLLKRADQLICELREIMCYVGIEGLTIQAKINQPEAGTND